MESAKGIQKTMSLANWRQFQFFNLIPIKDPYFGSDRALYSDPTMSGITSAGEYLVIVSDNAMVKLISSNFEQLAEWRVEDAGWSVSKLHWIKPSTSVRGILITTAERQGQSISLKLWDLDKLTSLNYNWMKFDHNSSFKSHSIISNTHGGNNYPMTCFDALPDYSIFAIGFSNGSIILVSGDLLHDRGTRQRVIYQSSEPITSIKFRNESLIYVATVNKVFTVETSGKNHGRLERILDDKYGSDLYCTDTIVRDINNKELVVIREDSIQYYNSKGKNHSIQLDMIKKKVHIYKNRYLLFSSPLTTDLIDASTHRIIIIDLINKYFVFNQTVKSSISDVFELWNDMYLLTSDGVLIKLHELSTHEKVDSVIKRELFPIAIKLANEDSKDFTEKEILNFYKLYGDYLYEKDEFKESILQYIECIKLKKTSEIIAKFKESSKIPLLVSYLEKMVNLKVTNSDHVTLLLSCYCKLKLQDKISKYVKTLEIDEDYDIVETHKKFDLKLIIELCKESGDFKLALMISQKFNLAENVIVIQLNDLKNPKLAMNYIQTLKIDYLLRILVDFSDSLLGVLPNEMTKLLIDVFTGNYIPKPSLNEDTIAEARDSIETTNEDNPLLTSYKQFVTFMKLQPFKPLDKLQLPSYLPPKPKIIFSIFAKHNYEFVIFLEACIDSYDKFDGKEEDKREIIITLYEMYLTLRCSKPDSDKEWKLQWESKAKDILLNKINWSIEDTDSLLLISNLYDFSEGELIIRSSSASALNDRISGYELDIFRSLTLSHNWDQSLKFLDEFGSKVPELYNLAMISYTKSDDVFNVIGEKRFTEILNTIEKHEYMSVLELVHTICSGGASVKLGILKPFIIRSVQKQKTQIEKDSKLVEAYDKKVKELEDNIHTVETETTIINSNGNSIRGGCEVCKGPVEFPMIFFKCGHQIHESCLIESVSENGSCPLCLNSQEAIEATHREFNEESLRAKVMLQRLGKRDRFKDMLAFLGRGGIRVNEANRVD